MQPVLRKQVGSFNSLEHSSESRRCRNGLISGSALSWLLGVLLKLLLPEALRCDGAVDSRPNNPRHAAFEGGGIAEEKNGLGDHLFGGNGREKMCLDELLPSGVPWVPWFVPAGASWLGRFVTAAVLLGKNKSRHIFPFHLPFFCQENWDVFLLDFTSRKSIAERFPLGDLCLMKFMPGAERQAEDDSSVFLLSAALIVCNDLISSTKQES